jgi:hypothetical protein
VFKKCCFSLKSVIVAAADSIAGYFELLIDRQAAADDN